MTLVINGPTNGHGLIFGNTTGDDIINAFGNFNYVVSQGANDTVNLLGSNGFVNLGSFSNRIDQINLYGSSSTIQGSLTTSSVTVNGGLGETLVSLKNTGGHTNVSLGGHFNRISLNADAYNTIVSGAGNATVAVGSVTDSDEGQGYVTKIQLAGTSNTVTGADPNFVINGGLGHDRITLEDGANTIHESGLNNVITVGSGANKIWAGSGADTVNITEGDLGGDDPGTPTPTDYVYLNGAGNKVNVADENVNISGGTGSGTFVETFIAKSAEYPTPTNKGNDNITTSGAHNFVSLLNGNDTVTITGDGGNTVNLGNGADTVNVAGNNNVISVGNGYDKITALGDGNTIVAGNGLASAGADTIKVGSDATVIGNRLKAGSVIDSIGSSNEIKLFGSSSATILDEPTGSGLFLELDGTAGKYTGNVTVKGFANDLLNGRIDFDGVNGANGASLDVGANPLNLFNVFANSASDGQGGVLIKLSGGGSLDLVGASVSGSTFV